MKWRKQKPKTTDSTKRKTVEFNGQTHVITTRDFGYTTQQMFVDGEGSSVHMPNNGLHDPESWKRYALQALQEHQDRKAAQEEFRYWDGKL